MESKSDVSTREALRVIADEGGYLMTTAWSEDRAWLYWPDERDNRLDDHFPLPPDFEFNTYQSAPSVGFMRKYRDPALTAEERRKQLKSFAAEYQEEDGRIKEKRLPPLVSRRDALQTQIRYAGERLRNGPLQEIRLLLIVWLEEAVREYAQEDKPDYLDVRHHARGIWKQISRGLNSSRLKEETEWLEKLFEHGSEVLAQAQYDRIIELLEDRDHVIKEAADARRKLLLCESVLRAGLQGDPLWQGPEKWSGTPMSTVLVRKRDLMEYAGYLHEETDRTLKEVYIHLQKKREQYSLPSRYSSFNSFKVTYYRFHNG